MVITLFMVGVIFKITEEEYQREILGVDLAMGTRSQVLGLAEDDAVFPLVDQDLAEHEDDRRLIDSE